MPVPSISLKRADIYGTPVSRCDLSWVKFDDFWVSKAMNQIAKSAALITALICLPGLAAADWTIEERFSSVPPPVLIANRAKVGGSPSNSLQGIRNSVELGIDMVKVDVRVTVDGKYILMHDPTLGTTTNVREVFPEGAPSLGVGAPTARRFLVADFTLAEISQLRLRSPSGDEHPVPTLEDALDLAAGRILMLINLHDWDDETLVALLRRRSTSNLLVFSTAPSGDLASTVEAMDVGVFESLTDYASATKALQRSVERYGSRLKLIGVTAEQFSPALRNEAREHGVSICIEGMWDLDDELRLEENAAPWRAALRRRADAYFTGLPEYVLELLAR